jgi:alpha-ketoglutaric semialdehyde dehydrogenase
MDFPGLSLIGAGQGKPGGKTFTGLNPATGEPLPGDFHSGSAVDVEAAVRLATAAFEVYAEWPGARRAALLGRVAEALEQNKPAIVERARLETALPVPRLEGELARTCFQLRLYGAAAASGLVAGARIDRADPGRQPQPKPDLRSMLIPLGPVAVFGASNFPLAYSVAGGDTASALAAGCPVIIKAHPAHPGVSAIVGQLVQGAVREMGAPEGVFSLLFDAGYEVGIALVRHPSVKAVGFTGSRRGGRALMDLAAARAEPIPVYAEMSSVNPVFILRETLRQNGVDIATGLGGAVTLGVGQFCTNPGLIFVENSAQTEPFLTQLSELLAATPAGTMLTPGICAAYRHGVETFSQANGVRQLTPAAAHLTDDATRAVPALFTTDAETFLGNPALMQEVFGPATLVVRCSSRAQMLAAARGLEGQLTATVHALPAELAASRELIEVLTHKAGRLIWNGFPTGVEVTHAMTHGGPYPATSDGRATSVGTRAVERFQRLISYQNFPDAALPPELQESNPLGITRLIDGQTILAAAAA